LIPGYILRDGGLGFNPLAPAVITYISQCIKRKFNVPHKPPDTGLS